MSLITSPHADEEALIRARIQGKSCALVEVEVLPELFRGLRDPDAPVGTKIAIARVLMDLGNLTPKKDATPQVQGSRFSIKIVIPGQPGTSSAPVTIEGEVIEGIPPQSGGVLARIEDNHDLLGMEYD